MLNKAKGEVLKMFFTGESNSSQSVQPFWDGANPDSMISGKPFMYFEEDFPAEADFASHDYARQLKEFSQQGVNSRSTQTSSLSALTAPSKVRYELQSADSTDLSWIDSFWTEATVPVPNQGVSSDPMSALSPSPTPIGGATSNLETQPVPSKAPMVSVTSHPTPAPANFGAYMGHGAPIHHPTAPVVSTVPRVCSSGDSQPGNSSDRPFLSDLLVNPYKMDERSRAIRFLREYPGADQGFQDTRSDVTKVIELAHEAGFFELERGYSNGPLSSFSYEIGDFSPFAMAVRYAKCPLIDENTWNDCEAHVKEILSTKLNAKGEIVLKELDLKCVEKSELAQKTHSYIQAVKYAREPQHEEMRWSFEKMQRDGIVDWLVKHKLYL